MRSPVAAIDQLGQLDAAGPAKIVQRVHRRARGAAAEQHVVHEHNGFAGDIEWDDGGVNFGRSVLIQIIAVH